MKTCQPFFGLRTLITGDVNTGKTSYLQLLLLKCRGRGPLVVLDMAPEKVRGVGGKMRVPSAPDIHYFTTVIRPPRLSAEDEDKTQRIAADNAEIIEKNLFKKAASINGYALIINDVSLYLQMGNLDRLLEIMEKYPTVVMNGYMGNTFKDSTLTRRERKNMEELITACDQVIQSENKEKS
jgi:hypothetical protein